jgi:hypothetical protein
MTAAVVAALQSALAAEHSACYGYGVVGAHLATGSAALAAAGADWIAHQRARDQLTAMIADRGGQPATAAVAYELPFPVTSATTAAQLAATMEDRVAQAYQALVALHEGELRMFGAQQVRVSALRAESWRGSTQAFPGLPPASLRR